MPSFMEHVTGANSADSPPAATDVTADTNLTETPIAEDSPDSYSPDSSDAPDLVDPDGDADAPQSEGKGDDEDSDESGDPFHKNPRFKQVIEERNATRAERDALKSERDALKAQAADAEAFADILADLKAEGYQDGKTAREGLAERGRQAQEAQAIQQEDADWHGQVAAALNEQIAKGEITQEYGELVYTNALQQRQIARFQQQSQQQQALAVQRETETRALLYRSELDKDIQAVKTSLGDPDLDTDLVRDLVLSTGGDPKEIAARISARDRSLRDSGRLAAAKQIGNANNAPPPSRTAPRAPERDEQEQQQARKSRLGGGFSRYFPAGRKV